MSKTTPKGVVPVFELLIVLTAPGRLRGVARQAHSNVLVPYYDHSCCLRDCIACQQRQSSYSWYWIAQMCRVCCCCCSFGSLAPMLHHIRTNRRHHSVPLPPPPLPPASPFPASISHEPSKQTNRPQASGEQNDLVGYRCRLRQPLRKPLPQPLRLPLP